METRGRATEKIQDVVRFIMNYAGVCTSVETCVAAWESTWELGLRCEAPAIQHHQAYHLGAVHPGNFLNEGCGILNLHSSMAAAASECE